MPSRFPRIGGVLARFLTLLLLIGGGFIHRCSNTYARGAAARPDDAVSVSVMGLFHPHEVIVTAVPGHALILKAGEQSVVLENSEVASATVRMDESHLILSSAKQKLLATQVEVAGREGHSEDFILEVPGKIKRRYHGVLTIKPSGGILLAVVTLDLETAVGSVVAAEGAPDTPMEALKAYAIAARSYLVSGRGRHRPFDFCDTTHCQFLRTPPPATSSVAQAVEATRGLVLAFESRPFVAMYTRSCSGRTRTPAQLGLPAAAYPYYSVECEHCRRRPVRWTASIPAQDAATLRSSDEGSRLAIAHHLGWSTLASNDFSLTKDGDRVRVTGVGNGHGIGLCQAGARAMAESGAGFRQILEHYYPNTDITQHSAHGRLD